MNHVIIHASAGSGKTFALSTRYLQLLADGADPATILATTFTRKAAGEIFDRVLRRLWEGAASAEGAARLSEEIECELTLDATRGILNQFIAAIDRVSIGTLDSHFNRIGSCFRLELGVPKNPAYLEDGDARLVALRDRSWDLLMENTEHATLLKTIRDLAGEKLKRSSANALDKVGALYSHCRNALWWADCDDEPRAADLGALEALADGDQAHAAALESARARRWDDFGKKGYASKILQGETEFKKKPIPPEIEKVYRDLFEFARRDVERDAARRTEATKRLLEDFDHHYSKLRRDARALLFSDLTHSLSRNDLELDVAYRLDARFHHLLLDEFQDTSETQWRIIKPVAEEIVSQDTRVCSEGRSFFCVGDIKQAIYGWRGGSSDILAGLHHELHLGDESVRSLTFSYRSSPVIIDAVNRVFSTVEDWRGSFELHEAKYDLPGCVEYFKVSEEDDLFEITADRIAKLVSENPARSVGVLVETNDRIHETAHRLTERGIESSREGGATLADDPAVSVILSALTWADHPSHTIAKFHVRNSPLAGLSDPLTIRREIVERGIADVIADWVRELLPHCDERSAAALESLGDLADGYPDGVLRPSDFAEFVRGRRVETPRAADVRIMTIEGSKGLEFDIVVLPDLNRKMGDVEKDEIYRTSLGVTRRVNKGLRIFSPRLEAAYREHSHRRRADDLCGFYVAMTRARHALHLIAPEKTKAGSAAEILENVFASGEILGDRNWSRNLPVRIVAEPVEEEAAPRTRAFEPAIKRVRPSRGRARLVRELFENADARREGRRAHKAFEEIGADSNVELWRERPFLVRDGDEILEGRFDRVEITREPTRAVIIDYKSSAAIDASDQLDIYRRALAKILGIEKESIEARVVIYDRNSCSVVS